MNDYNQTNIFIILMVVSKYYKILEDCF